MPDPSLFDERDPLLRTMDAVIAPVAASANALVDDLRSARSAPRIPDEHAFDLRFDHFVRMGMPLPAFRKKFEQRYVFNPASAIAALPAPT